MAVILDPPPTASTSAATSDTPPPAETKPLSLAQKAAARMAAKAGGAGGAAAALPTEYKLEMQNPHSKNLFVFGEKEEELEDSGEVGHRKRRREWRAPSRSLSPTRVLTAFPRRRDQTPRDRAP